MDKSPISEIALLLQRANDLCEDAHVSLETTGKPKTDLDYYNLKHVEALLGYLERARGEAARLLAL